MAGTEKTRFSDSELQEFKEIILKKIDKAERDLDLLREQFANDKNDLVGAHKTPTLRNVAATAPYMHGGQIDELLEVVRHYNDAPTSMLSHNEAKPLELREVQLQQLTRFLETLSAPLATEGHWLTPPSAQ